MKEAERRQTQGHQPPHLAMRRALNGARTLAGVPPRLSPEGIIPSQRLSFRPGFLGRGLHGRYPPSPVPVQGCTSHPGRNAGRHDAQAAREQAANPPAGTALAPMTRCASAPCPSLERGLCSNGIRDNCQVKSDNISSLPCRGIKGGLRPPSFLLRTPMRSIGYARFSAAGGEVRSLRCATLPLAGEDLNEGARITPRSRLRGKIGGAGHF